MKLNPLLRLIITQPQLFVEHAKAYSSLVSDEFSKIIAGYKKLIILGIAALFLGVMAVALSGIGLVLWAILAANNMVVPWALVAAPAVPAILCAYCVWKISQHKISAFADLSSQINEDVRLIKEGGSV